MANETSGGMLWKAATAALAVTTAGLGVSYYLEHQTASSLSSQLTAASAEATRAHDEASALKAQLVTATQRLESADAQLRTEQQQLGADQQRIASESRPDLPVDLTFRAALISQGKVATIRNRSDTTLELMLDVLSPATGLHFHRALVINARGAEEVGSIQGWTFATGQIVRLSNPNFRSIQIAVTG